MAYTRISAAGALPGQVSPAEEMAMRRMAMMGGGGYGGGGGGGASSPPSLFEQWQADDAAKQQQERQDRLFSAQEGYDKRMLKRQTRRDMELGLMEGAQERDVTKMKMAPSQQYADLQTRQWDEGAPLRNAEMQTRLTAREKLNRLLAGGTGSPAAGAAPTDDPAAIARASMQASGFGPSGAATAAPTAGGGDADFNRMLDIAMTHAAATGQPFDVMSMFHMQQDLPQNVRARQMQERRDRLMDAEAARRIQADPTSVPQVLAALESGDFGQLPPEFRPFDAPQMYRQAATEGQVTALLEQTIPQIDQFIRANNWSIKGNLPELEEMFQAAMQKVKDSGGSPEAIQYADQLLRETILKAARETGGTVIPRIGQQDLEARYGTGGRGMTFMDDIEPYTPVGAIRRMFQ